MHHGKLEILWQPNEIVIIGGAALGGFIIANTGETIKRVGKSFKNLFKGKPYKKTHYIELLSFMFQVFKLMKTKGMLAIESHIENPHESDIFKKFPSILHDHHVVDLFCDYFRLLTMGIDNHMQIEELLDKELEIHHHESASASSALAAVGDAMPALGIVAAVLGVITTMKSITEPPEVLGGLIAAALVGTFLGILFSYGVIAPMSTFLGKYAEAEGSYYQCIKVAIIAHMQGTAPTITVEFARKNIPSSLRPSFSELEEALNGADKTPA